MEVVPKGFTGVHRLQGILPDVVDVGEAELDDASHLLVAAGVIGTNGGGSAEATASAGELAQSLFTLLYEEDSTGEPNAVVWLSPDCFVSLRGDILPEDDNGNVAGDLLQCPFYTEVTVANGQEPCLYFYKRVASTEPINGAIDALLALLAAHSGLNSVDFLDGDHPFAANAPFPASSGALQNFVHAAASPREVDLQGLRLSSDQWKAVFTHCSDNVRLHFGNRDWSYGGATLIEAMNENNCPRRLWLYGFEAVNAGTLTSLGAAIQGNTSLLELHLSNDTIMSEHMAVCLKALSKNKGIQKLETNGGLLTDDEWKVLWSSVIASHPSLKTVNLGWSLASMNRAQDDLIVQALRSNKNLCDVEYDMTTDLDHEFYAKYVKPVMELNRFRPVAEKIKAAAAANASERVFATILLSDRVRHSHYLRYYLLRRNSDLLGQQGSAEEAVTVANGVQDANELPSPGKRKR